MRCYHELPFPHARFESFDLISINLAKQQVRLLKFNDSWDAHPHITCGYVFDMKTGKLRKSRCAGQIYHRVHTMLSPTMETKLYLFHKNVFQLEEAMGLYKKTPSGSAKQWNAQVAKSGLEEDYYSGIPYLRYHTKQILTLCKNGYASGTTAIGRTKPSLPIQYWAKRGLLKGKGQLVLHHGAGRPDNPDREFITDLVCANKDSYVHHYDPNHGDEITGQRNIDRQGKYDLCLSAYVLNVLTPNDRSVALVEIKRTMHDGARAYFAVRSKQTLQPRPTWTPFEDGYIVPIGKNKVRFQRGYTVEELRAELQWYFRIVNVEELDSSCVLAECIR